MTGTVSLGSLQVEEVVFGGILHVRRRKETFLGGGGGGGGRGEN
jgi:hypothetical protein